MSEEDKKDLEKLNKMFGGNSDSKEPSFGISFSSKNNTQKDKSSFSFSAIRNVNANNQNENDNQFNENEVEQEESNTVVYQTSTNEEKSTKMTTKEKSNEQ